MQKSFATYDEAMTLLAATAPYTVPTLTLNILLACLLPRRAATATDDPDRLYESRFYTPFRAGAGAAGLGSSRCGGKPSCRAGDTHAFGCAHKDIRCTALGCAECGVEADGPFVHTTGKGYVAPRDKGQYADALANGRSRCGCWSRR